MGPLLSQGRRWREPQEPDPDCRFFTAPLFAAALPPTFTPEFLSSTVAASFAARAIAGSLRTRVLRDRAVDQQGKLGCKRFCLRDAKLHQQVAKPEAAAFLEGDGNLSDRPVFAEFGDRIDERTATKIFRRKAPFQRIEGAENLLDRRFV